MTTQIKLKKSSVSGNIPDSGDLQYGELAINFADGKLFYKNSSNEIKAFIEDDGSRLAAVGGNSGEPKVYILDS